MPPFSIHSTRKSSMTGDRGVAEDLVAGKRCLVLDDEFLIALDIQQILETAGAASVVCAGNAADALDAVRRGPRFDLAVLDVKLSGDTGSSITVAAALVEQNTPFVFLTGMRGETEHTRKFPRSPIVDKPYQASALLEALRRVLGEG